MEEKDYLHSGLENDQPDHGVGGILGTDLKL
ncbi:hypothetical protein A2U01_0077994, partial [Trifolium medium]|nr:hypothetical protein [Trifolium medium]